MHTTLDATTTMDAAARLEQVAASASTPLLDALARCGVDIPAEAYAAIQIFRKHVAAEGLHLLDTLRHQFLTGKKGKTPASEYLGRTKAMYEFVRIKLGIAMHGWENLTGFEEGINETELTIGHNISLIYEVGDSHITSAQALMQTLYSLYAMDR